MALLPMWGDPLTTGQTYKAANSRSASLLRRIGATAAAKRGRKIKGPYRGKNLSKQRDRTVGF